MPAEVKSSFGVAFFVAQTGGEAENAKALKGFGGRGVLEVIDNHDGDLRDAETWHRRMLKEDK